MGVDYDGIGGIGLVLKEEHINILMKNGVFTKEDWEEDRYECAECIGIPYYSFWNAYVDPPDFCLIVEGDTLGEVNRNAQDFVDKLNHLGIKITVDELEVVSEMRVS